MAEYNHLKIERKWQEEWEKKKVYYAENNSKKKKYYSLIEFPYPSGDGLHVGHPRPYIGMDVISRYRRMQGFNVLYPIGWDAFGLPTENYAIKTSLDPRVVTKKNSDTFRRQIKILGISFDWSREINTTDPKYYKWTQWIFLQFFKKGLAYKAKMMINWCPSCKIGLANEEVLPAGRQGSAGACERCGTAVEKREKEQWMLAITKYADRLDKDLDAVDYLPQIKLGQRNWIGKSEGAEIDFKIHFTPAFPLGESLGEVIKVFTTRADTIFGAFAIILAPEHALVQKLKSRIQNWNEVEKYIGEVKKKTDIERTDKNKEKTGVELKGLKAINLANNEEIPVWVADFILAQYGTGAVFADMHDERDFRFAKKYNLPTKSVLEPVFIEEPKEGLSFVERDAIHAIVKHWSENKFLVLYWKQVSWTTFVTGGIDPGENPKQAAIREIQEETGYMNLKFIKELPKSHSKFYHIPKKENRFAHFHSFYFELEDGEQRDLSEEEKAIHELKWVSPEEIEKSITPGGSIRDWKILQGEETPYTGYGILTNSGKFNGFDSQTAIKKITEFVGGKIVTRFKLRDWIFSRQRYWGEPIPLVFCPACAEAMAGEENPGWIAVPERDLPVELPKVKNWEPSGSGESPLANIAKWVNVKCPRCKGKAKRETDTMPNWAGSSWYYLRYTDPHDKKEFASQKNLKYWTPVDWYNGGNEHTTLHLLYSRFWHKFLFDLGLVPTKEPYKKRTSHGLILAEGGEKMSKSKGNVINPDDIVRRYGADTLRLYEMFMGPFDQAIAWSEEAIIGPRRFLERVWRTGKKIFGAPTKNSSVFALGDKRTGDRRFKFLSERLTKLLHQTIKKVGEDIETMRFNTAVSAMMILSNEMENTLAQGFSITKEDYKKFVQILAPFAPHIAEELWNMLGEKKSINLSSWPQWDKNLIKEEEIKIAVQINGRVRAEIIIQTDEKEEEVKKKALAARVVLKYTSGKSPKRIIYVKNKLINIVP